VVNTKDLCGEELLSVIRNSPHLGDPLRGWTITGFE